MKEQHKCRFLVAAPECSAAKFEGILTEIGMEPDVVCLSGEETLREAEGEHVLLLTAYRLPDMSGEELAVQLGDEAEVLMIVPNDYEEEETSGALLLRNPLSPDALLQAIRATQHLQGSLMEARERVKKLERQLEERKIVDRAKGRLIDQLSMTESQAHYHIQKKSMDTGRRIVDIAREILEAEVLSAEN